MRWLGLEGGGGRGIEEEDHKEQEEEEEMVWVGEGKIGAGDVMQGGH